MKDVLDELAAVRRKMGSARLPAGDAYTMELTRRYDANLDDVWDAITSPARLSRWMAPIVGDLRLGGGFELESGEHGEVLRCEPPRLLRVSWMFGPGADEWPGTSEVEVRLASVPDGSTELDLVHAASVGDPLFPTYGPGAGGVGWDLLLLVLRGFLEDGEVLDHDELRASPVGRAHPAQRRRLGSGPRGRRRRADRRRGRGRRHHGVLPVRGGAAVRPALGVARIRAGIACGRMAA